MNRRIAAIAASLATAAVVAVVAAVLSSAPANAGGSTPAPPSVQRTITGW